MNYINEDELYFDRECDQCLDKVCTLDHIRGYMEGVVGILFGTKPFDKVKLENYIDEICGSLDLPMPNGQIAVRETKEAHVKRWNEMVSHFMEKAQ